jgi:hypothetical protein
VQGLTATPVMLAVQRLVPEAIRAL